MTDRPNRVLYSHDCLDVLNDELALPSGSVDLIYLDPPFNSKNRYNLPFKGKDRNSRPVEAFKDTWTWGDKEEELLQRVDSGPSTRRLADIVRLAQSIEGRGVRLSLAAYLLNMAVRLMPMRRVLAETGSIYLHCDPTASHYLKLIMDAIFGMDNFLNEIVWAYRKWTNDAKIFQQNHDVLLVYARARGLHKFNKLVDPEAPQKAKYDRGWDVNVVQGGLRQLIVYDREKAAQKIKTSNHDRVIYRESKKAVALPDHWNIPFVNSQAKERLGYPTQKPLALIRRIIEASSDEGDLVLDPFCGCGTTIHAAEELKRRWAGIDVSSFSVGLMKERILENFGTLSESDVLSIGVPTNVGEAKALAARDKFEFEKWVCGEIGAEGMFHDPGTRGADGGVDGVIKFYPLPFGTDESVRKGKRFTAKPEYAIVQVKGGRVTPDAVRALKATVDKYGAKAGVMVCFNEYMGTVENQRAKAMFRDAVGEYPVIQGLSVERLLGNDRPDLPLYGKKRRGGLVSALV